MVKECTVYGDKQVIIYPFLFCGCRENCLVEGSPEIHGLPVLIVSVVAAGAMILCARILGSIESDDFNMRSVMLDTVADAAAAIGVAISGAIILAAHGAYWLDATVALAIAVVVGYHAVRLIREVLRESSPFRPRG